MVAIRGGVAHHTATPASAPGDYPTLGVVRDGRAGLAGPLSQLGVGRSGTWYVIASGRANHAGTVHDRYAGTHANRYALGVEAEHPGGSTPWPAVQYASYVRGCAALARRYGITWLGHKEVAAPAGRKSDPSFDMAAFRAALGATTVSNSGGSFGPLPTAPDLTPIAPIKEDEMSAAGEAAILAALSNIETILAREGGNGLRGDVQTAIARATEARDWTGTVANELRAGLTSLGQAIRAGGSVTVDASGIAAALAESLGDDLARQVADELADRLSRA